MKDKVLFVMSQEQLKRYTVIEKTIEGISTIKEAAQILGLSDRQVIRLKKGVKENGVAALIHKNKGRKSAHLFLMNLRIPLLILNPLLTTRMPISSIFRSS